MPDTTTSGIEQDKRLQDDYRFIYKIVVDDIKNAQDSQWRVANYAIAVFGVLAATCRILLERHGLQSGYDRIVYAGFGATVLLFSGWLIVQQQKRLLTARQRLHALRGFLHPEVHSIIDLAPVDVKMAHSQKTTWIHFAVLVLSYCLFSCILWFA